MLSRGSSVTGSTIFSATLRPFLIASMQATAAPARRAASCRTVVSCGKFVRLASLFLLYGGAAYRAKIKRVTSHKKRPAFLANLPKQPGHVHRLWINFLSSPCLTAAFRMIHVRKTSMGSMIVFLTAPEVR